MKMGKRSFSRVNPHEPKAHKRSKKYDILLQSLPLKDGKFPLPLWERVKVRGIFVSIL